MSSRKKLLLALCIAVAAVAWAYIKGSQSDRETRYSSSTYSAGPWGCKALYLVLEELKLPVERLRQSFRRLRSHRGVLVITGPLRAPVSSREKAALQEWIKEGNRLIVCDGSLNARFARIQGEDHLSRNKRVPLQRLQSSSSFLNLRLQEFPDSPRTTLVAPLPNLDASARIGVSGESRWKELPEGWSSVIKDGAGPILVCKTMGKGSVFALADVTLASNAHIRDEQNLRLILAMILAADRPEEILFDEFHQGHAAEQTLWAYLGSSIFAWAALQGVVGLGLFFFSKRAQYVGRYRSLTSRRGRSSLEYVDSMAGIYESCKAGPLALESTLNRFLGRLSRRTGIPLKRLIETSPDRFAELVPSGQSDLAELIRSCRRVARAGDQTPEALALARRLASTTRGIKGLDESEEKWRA